jgi:hypothetical protein
MTIGPAVLVAILASQAHETRTPPETSPASIAGLPKRLAHDGKRLFTTTTPALVMAAGGAAAFAVHPADHQSVRSLSMSGGLEEFLDGGADAGDGTVQGLTAVGVYRRLRAGQRADEGSRHVARRSADRQPLHHHRREVRRQPRAS